MWPFRDYCLEVEDRTPLRLGWAFYIWGGFGKANLVVSKYHFSSTEEATEAGIEQIESLKKLDKLRRKKRVWFI